MYRSQVPRIAEDIINTFSLDGDIVVEAPYKEEAERDVRAIMEEYLRTESKVVQETRELMERRQITYDQFGKVKSGIADNWSHKTGDDGIRYIVSQILEMFMISNNVEEVFGDDRNMRKTLMRIYRKHLVEEADLDREVRSRLKNLRPGSEKWDIEYKRVMDDVRRKRGLTG
ncbi:MAG: DUF507 family protein [Deltaproteobacteria bacterium]|nr:DUF507 family protein [Deltaproteobacteria bacterium]